jgi:Holliday junction resolvase RusA-like endonuclease
VIRLTLPYPPSTNARLAFYKGRTLLSSEARAYKLAVKARCNALKLKPLTGDVHLTLDLYRPRKSGDISNRIKTIEDALEGFAYVNDSQVARLTVNRFEDKKNPRCEVSVSEPSTPTGATK